MKKIFNLLSVCLFCCMLMVSCGSESNVAVISNSFTEVDSLDKVKEVLGFDINISGQIFDGEHDRIIRIVDAKLVEVHYNQFDNWIIIRKSLYSGDRDISGDYNEYPQTSTHLFKDIELDMRGTDDKINVVSWRLGDYIYSLNINPGGIGFDKDRIYDIVSKIN